MTTINRPEPIEKWLRQHSAACLWSIKGPRDTQIIRIEAYRVRAAVVLVMLYEHDGWDLFTSSPSIQVSETLADASRRTGTRVEERAIADNLTAAEADLLERIGASDRPELGGRDALTLGMLETRRLIDATSDDDGSAVLELTQLGESVLDERRASSAESRARIAEARADALAQVMTAAAMLLGEWAEGRGQPVQEVHSVLERIRALSTSPASA